MNGQPTNVGVLERINRWTHLHRQALINSFQIMLFVLYLILYRHALF